MQKGQASRTAWVSALMRAIHPLWDAAPNLFHDDWAGKFVGVGNQAALRSQVDKLIQELTTLTCAATAQDFVRIASRIGALRARVAEDVVEAAAARGVRQLVIIGAGYDSFAYRRADLSALQLFELDHPDTQNGKLARLEELGVRPPDNLSLVPVDFREQPSIVAALRKTPYRHEQPAVFQWLGGTWYFPDGVLDRMLLEIASAAPAGELVFDYLLPDERLPPAELAVMRLAEKMAAGSGEPGGRRFAPEHWMQRLQAFGFTDFRDLGGRSATLRYWATRSDSAQVPEMVHVLTARIERTRDGAG
jgi:methyltransferase (TIGR00027 family)